MSILYYFGERMKQISMLFLLALFVAGVMVSGCGKKEIAVKLKEPTLKKYPFKSSIAEYSYSGDGSGTMRHYIDYWGAFEMTEDKSTIKMMGQEKKNNMLMIVDQDTIIQMDLDKKTGMKQK